MFVHPNLTNLCSYLLALLSSGKGESAPMFTHALLSPYNTHIQATIIITEVEWNPPQLCTSSQELHAEYQNIKRSHTKPGLQGLRAQCLRESANPE